MPRAPRFVFAAPSLSFLVATGLVATGCVGDDTNTPLAAGTPDASMSVPPVDAALPPITDATRIPYDGTTEAGPPVARTPVHAEMVTNRVDTQALMFAAGEMQISGEPFAQNFAGRNLNDYDRTYLPPDQYILNNGSEDPTPITDLFGFSTAVESYEYSKMHMNMVCNQSAAGLSLASAPVIAARTETTPLLRMQGRSNELLTAAGSDVAGYATLPPPTGNPLNYLGFQGLWPNFAPFKSFDPTMSPSAEVVQSCTFSGGYGGIPTINSLIPEFECAYNSLHLTNRDVQVEKTLVPAVIGFSTWKEALWSIDFAGRLHDAGSNPVTVVQPADLPLVGTKGNMVTGGDNGAVPGTYLGSTPLEDMWGLMMLEEMNNAAEFLVGSLMTGDGAKLGGFATKKDALAYGYSSPVLWFPASVAITEDETITPFPGIATKTITDATSRSVDLAALLLGYAMNFGETDPRNAAIGQRIGLTLTFDGNPFPKDDGQPDGEDTPHDRALAVLRVAAVDLDRIHFVSLNAGGGVLVDTATVSGSTLTPGTTATTVNLAHALIGLRQALLSLNGAISQYGAADPSPTADEHGILNTPAIQPPAPGAATTVSGRLRQLIQANGAFVRDVLTKSDGSVANGATVAQGAATASTDATSLETQAAAVRALTETYLVTLDSSFLDRARLVAAKLQTDFYSAPARLYRGTLGGADVLDATPDRFAWLQSALRETYKVLHVEGDPALGRDVLEDRIARVNKLLLNGWDDLDGNQKVDKKTECIGVGLQQGEQALTGELGLDAFGLPTIDRDNDCVQEIDGAKVGSLLAGQVHFHSP